MELINLETCPDYYDDTICLIESSFGYKEGHSFAVDFSPLMSRFNWRNNHIIVDDGKVVAHTGVLMKKISLTQEHNIAFIGGVAVREDYRGQGLAGKLLNHALNERPSCALYILWSDKTELYKKFGFFPCVELYSCSQREGKSSFEQISRDDNSWKEIQLLYNGPGEIRIKREPQDWEELKKIHSADLYAKIVNGRIENYFFMNKGMDLTNIIHEYGSLTDVEEMRTHGTLWTSKQLKGSTALYGSLVKIGDLNCFKRFVSEYTQGALEIESIVQEVRFKFKGKLYSLGQEDFLQGLFGPGKLKELQGLPKLFISGLDSI